MPLILSNIERVGPNLEDIEYSYEFVPDYWYDPERWDVR